MIHGVLLLATALLIPAVLNLIPLACLASILLIIGYKLSSVTVMREMWREGTAHVVPFIVTLVAIIATDILVGVGIGLLVSVMFSYRYRNSTET
jgi:MFS superfamily sulfate permease-like transporter